MSWNPFERKNSPSLHEATINQAALEEFEDCWKDFDSRLRVIPGKEAMSVVNRHLQENYGISVTPTAIVDAMEAREIPADIRELVHDISRFASTKVNQ